MPRPRKTEARRLSRQIIFRIKAEDYAQLEAQAEKAGMSVNQLARKLTCNRKGQLVIKTEGRLDPAFIAQIRAIGYNLNQITRKFHMTGRMSSRMCDVLSQIEDIVFEVIDAEDEP